MISSITYSLPDQKEIRIVGEKFFCEPSKENEIQHVYALDTIKLFTFKIKGNEGSNFENKIVRILGEILKLYKTYDINLNRHLLCIKIHRFPIFLTNICWVQVIRLGDTFQLYWRSKKIFGSFLFQISDLLKIFSHSYSRLSFILINFILFSSRNSDACVHHFNLRIFFLIFQVSSDW